MRLRVAYHATWSASRTVAVALTGRDSVSTKLGSRGRAAVTSMAEKKAKTAEKNADALRKHLCPSCGSESRVVQYVGSGPRGFFWVCDKNCGYTKRTR